MNECNATSSGSTPNESCATHDQAGVLLLGNYRPSLALARSLNRSGYRVVLGSGGGEGCGEYSRSVDHVWHHSPLEDDPEVFIRALYRFLEGNRTIRYVFPVAEEFVRTLSAHRHALPNDVTLVLADHTTIAQCTDKIGLLSLAESVGIAAPAFKTAKLDDQFANTCAEIGFPVAVRPLPPLGRLAHKKAIFLHTTEEANALCQQFPNSSGQVLVQRKVCGEREDIIFAARDGEIVRAMQVRYLRTDDKDGTGLCVYGEVVALSSELMTATRRLTQALSYNGIGCAQFIRDRRQGADCLVELNPRVSAIHQITEEMKMELGQLAIAIADGLAPSTPFTYVPGHRFAWTYGELRAIRSALRHKEISGWHALQWVGVMMRSAITANSHLTWKLRDPAPTFALYARQLFARGSSSRRSTNGRRNFREWRQTLKTSRHAFGRASEGRNSACS